MAPSSGGDVAVCMTGDLKKKEHGPCSPGATACLFRGWGATGGVKAMSASTVRRILRQEGLPGKAKDQDHGCVVALLREGYIVRKHPGPMRFGCFECCDCGNRDILSAVKRIVRARLRLDHCEMPVGGHSGDDGVRLSTHANVIGEDGISHAALGSLCEPNYPSPEATEVVPAYSLQGPWMRHDLEHFDSDCRDQLQPVSLSAGALDGVGSGSYCELDGAALGPDLGLYHPFPLKPDLMIRVEWFVTRLNWLALMLLLWGPTSSPTTRFPWSPTQKSGVGLRLKGHHGHYCEPLRCRRKIGLVEGPLGHMNKTITPKEEMIRVWRPSRGNGVNLVYELAGLSAMANGRHLVVVATVRWMVLPWGPTWSSTTLPP